MSNFVTSASNAWCMLHLSRELPLRQFSEASCSQFRAFSTTGTLAKIAPSKTRRFRPIYMINRARKRKAENVARQDDLQKKRAEARGDPIRGVTTPFVESFDTGFLSPDASTAESSSNSETMIASEKASDQPPNDTNPTEELLKGKQLNFLVQHEELREAMRRAPYATYAVRDGKDAENANESQSQGQNQGQSQSQSSNNKKFKNNLVAMTRILSLDNGNSLDLMTHNTQRCIETFGRHNTDKSLPPKPPSLMSVFHNETKEKKKNKKMNEALAREVSKTDTRADGDTSFVVPSATAATTTTTTEPPQDLATPSSTTTTSPSRAGPDTGSSEVQIAILTAKIRALATALETQGRQDKMNKHNLRVLVHRRQKLLRYLRRKERGGPRWQNVIETLGLTEGTWSGEISL